MTDQLRAAAQAVLDRWDSPKWEWATQGPTADLMAELRAALAQQAEPRNQCRSDGRCQYAIDHGAEGMGHCPKGKCVMAQHTQPAEDRAVAQSNLRVMKEMFREQAEPVEPVAWRVRGYNQFKTGEPRPWRYVDGTGKPAINTPDCCDFEPLYTTPPQQAEPAQEPVAKVELMTTGGNAGLATRIVEIDDHLRERLRPGQLLYTAPPQQAEPVEPVAWLFEDTLPDEYPYDAMWPYSSVRGGVRMFPVFAPPQRKPLTDEEIDRLWHDSGAGIELRRFSSIARAVERALEEKNRGR